MREADRKAPKGKEVNPITGETGGPTAPATDPPEVQMIKNLRVNSWWDKEWENKNSREKYPGEARRKYEANYDRIFGRRDRSDDSPQ